MLKLLLITPLLGCLPLIFITPEQSSNISSQEVSKWSESDPALSSAKLGAESAKTNSLMKCIALTASLITLLLSVLI
jgi:hypothetical protein